MRTWQIVCVVVALAACGDNNKPEQGVDAPMSDSGGRSRVERGRYIMNNLAVCTFCHTPLNPDGSRDLTRLFAGVDCFVDIDPTPGVGCVNSRNLTNDPTGLMYATDAQIKYAFKNGYRTDGKPLSPVMPYWIFHNMSDEDADSIVAYLRTVPGVNHVVPPNELPWSMWNDGLVPQVPFLDATKIPMPSPAFADQESAIRGRYLSAMVGLCVDCHTPVDASMVQLDQTKFFNGGRMFTKEQLGLVDASYPAVITSRNITSDPTTGIGNFTDAQVKAAIADGKDPMGNAVCAATHGSVISPYAALDAKDLDDITNYIRSLAPVVNDTGTNCAGPPVP